MNRKIPLSVEKDYESFVYDLSSMKDAINVLRSSGKSRPIQDFPLLEYYLNDTGKFPFVKSYDDVSLNHIDLVEDLRASGAEEIFVKDNASEKEGNIVTRVESAVYRLQKGYFVSLSVGYYETVSYDDDIQIRLKEISPRENLAMISSMTLLRPGDHSPLYSKDVEDMVHALAVKHLLQRSETKPYIGMICKENSFYIKDFYITKNYTLNNADLHYGRGFEDFHKELLERFKSDPKGLVLFHGDPGTGKTYYIRNLIKDLIKIGKQVIYFPPNMVGHLVSPEIMTFLSSTVVEMAESGKSCVLLLEDAEPLLVSRGIDGRSDGITNLLNITDGLLNDMLSIQVIATFNTDLRNIDEALLRPERLIARKEFKKLSAKDAEQLSVHLNMDKTFENDVTLAEIYSQRKANEVLVHEYSPTEKRKIGF
jgi:hypothetical protein